MVDVSYLGRRVWAYGSKWRVTPSSNCLGYVNNIWVARIDTCYYLYLIKQHINSGSAWWIVFDSANGQWYNHRAIERPEQVAQVVFSATM